MGKKNLAAAGAIIANTHAEAVKLLAIQSARVAQLEGALGKCRREFELDAVYWAGTETERRYAGLSMMIGAALSQHPGELDRRYDLCGNCGCSRMIHTTLDMDCPGTVTHFRPRDSTWLEQVKREAAIAALKALPCLYKPSAKADGDCLIAMGGDQGLIAKFACPRCKALDKLRKGGQS